MRPWNKGSPGMRPPSVLGFRLVNPPPTGSASGCVKADSKRCMKADMGTQLSCEARCARFWKIPVGKLPIPPVTRSKPNLPSSLL